MHKRRRGGGKAFSRDGVFRIDRSLRRGRVFRIVDREYSYLTAAELLLLLGGLEDLERAE